MSFDSETGDEETWDNYRSEPQMELSDYLERQERIDILHEAILTLRDPYKSIIVLELAEVPRREIGKKLKLSETNVKVMLFRARGMLKKAINGRLD